MVESEASLPAQNAGLERGAAPRKRKPKMTPEHLIAFVQSLKGAPASVLIALAFTGREMSHRELQLWARCGPAQVTFAVHSLTETGWVSGRSKRGPWSLAEGRRLSVRKGRRKTRDFKSLSSCSSSSLTTDTSVNEKEQEQESARRKQLLDAMFAVGIQEPIAGSLADLPYVTPEYVRVHVEKAKKEGHALGTAIYRMQHAWPAPSQELSRQEEVEERIREFMNAHSVS